LAFGLVGALFLYVITRLGNPVHLLKVPRDQKFLAERSSPCAFHIIHMTTIFSKGAINGLIQGGIVDSCVIHYKNFNISDSLPAPAKKADKQCQ